LREILARTTGTTQSQIQPVFDATAAPAAIEELKALVREVMVAEPLERYIIGVIGGCTPAARRDPRSVAVPALRRVRAARRR